MQLVQIQFVILTDSKSHLDKLGMLAVEAGRPSAQHARCQLRHGEAGVAQRPGCMGQAVTNLDTHSKSAPLSHQEEVPQPLGQQHGRHSETWLHAPSHHTPAHWQLACLGLVPT